MKIAIVSPWLVKVSAVGGTERFVIDLAESLEREGHSVDVFMFQGEDYTQNNVRYTSIGLLGDSITIDEYLLKKELGDFSLLESYSNLAVKIESLLDLSDYDVIHCNTQLLLRAWQTKKRVFTIHTNPFEFRQAWGASSYQTMINIAREESHQATFTAPSRYYSDLFSNEIGSEVHFIPHAIDPHRLESKKNKHQLCSRYSLNPEKLHILLPSRLEPVQKQPWLLFDALQYLPPDTREKIEIISSGVDVQYEIFKEKYINQASQLGVSVHFARFENMSDAYAIADMVILPSQSESFGYAALESLSLGISTLMNDIPTFREIAIGNSAARFFDNDATQLGEKIEEVISNDPNRQPPSIGWKNRYSIDQWAKNYEELLSWNI